MVRNISPWGARLAATIAVASLYLIPTTLMGAAPSYGSSSKARKPQAASKSTNGKPEWRQVESTVRNQFSTKSGYQAGDIISRSEAEKIVTNLSRLGWQVPQKEQLLNRVPADSSWLVRTLRTDKGRQFGRQVANIPSGYDRVDRMTALSDGRRIITALIAGPGGAQLIDSLNTSTTGKGTAKQLAAVPGGSNMNKPTGMLYTADDLLAELSRLYGTQPSARGTTSR